MTKAVLPAETWFVRALLGAYALFFVWQALALDASALVNGVLDDSFYYLQVARNVAAGHGSTFDGVEPTNGYHPLWMWLLTPIHWLATDPIAVMRLALLLSGALGFGSLLFLRRISRRVAVDAASTAAPIALLLFAWPRFAKQTSSLLETPLVLLLYLAVFDTFLSRDLTRRRDRVFLGALLGLACLARLDSVFLLAAFIVIEGLRAPGAWRRIIEPLGVAGLILAPYLAWNLVTFGHLQPISGAMKSSFPAVGWSVEPWRAFPEFTILLAMALWFALVALRALLAPGRRKSPSAPEGVEPAWILALGLFGLASLLHALYTTLFMSWGVDVWHFTLLLPVALLGIPWTLDRALARAIADLDRRRTARWALLGFGLLAAIGAQAKSLELREGRHLDTTRGLALWARDSLPEDAVYAGTDTGVFAYFSRRTTINLDGLINNYRYRDALLAGRLNDYLVERKVGYVFDQFAVGRPDWIDGSYVSRTLRLWDRPRARVAGELVLYREDEVRRIPLRSRQTLGSNERAANAITLWRYRRP